MNTEKFLNVSITTQHGRKFCEIFKMVKKSGINFCALVFEPELGLLVREQTSNTILLKINFPKNCFKYFECKQKVIIYLDTASFTKSLELEDLDLDVLNLFMIVGQNNQFYVNRTSNFVNCLFLQEYHVPQISGLMNFSAKTKMRTLSFPKFLDEIRKNGKNIVEFETYKNYIKFGQKIQNQPDIPDKIKCEFNLNDLLRFQECHQICDYTELYFKNDFPMVQILTVPNFSKVLIFYCPKYTTNVDFVNIKENESKRKIGFTHDDKINKYQKCC